jgi:hypothetical protein
MLTKTLMAVAIAVVVTVPMATGASAQDGFGGRPGPQYNSSRDDSWGDGCLVWRRGLDYFGRERLVQVNICN